MGALGGRGDAFERSDSPHLVPCVAQDSSFKMGFISAGGLTGVLLAIVLGACIGGLLPQVAWSTHKMGNETQTLSLWENCTKYTVEAVNETVTITECHSMGKLKTSDLKSVTKAERDAAIAGLVLGGFFCLASLGVLICRSKCASFFMGLLVVLGTGAALGCWVRYQIVTLNDLLANGEKYSLGPGVWLAAVAVGCSILAMFSSCCIKKGDREGYGYLA